MADTSSEGCLSTVVVLGGGFMVIAGIFKLLDWLIHAL